MLLKGEQRHTYALGKHILEASEHAEKVIDLVLSGLARIPKGERNPALLGGMIASAEKRDPSLIDRKLDAVDSAPTLIQLLPRLTAQTMIEMRDLERIATSVRAGRILPREVGVLAMGSVLSHLAP